jgi:hypothetical protein
MKYSINYIDKKHGLTKHCFDNLKELKSILKTIPDINIERTCDEMPKNMYMLCLEHNNIKKPDHEKIQ